MRKSKNFRLDEVSAARLDEMSKEIHLSQADILNMLIDSCFDFLCSCIVGDEIPSVKGFGRLEENIKYRLKTISGGGE